MPRRTHSPVSYTHLIGLLLFGFNGIVASHIALESSQIVLLRTLLGSVSLLAFFFLLGHRFSFTGRGRDVTLVLLSGAAMGASWMFLYAGYQTIGVSTASLLYYCCPVIVMALSPLVFHEALTWVKITGFVCVCGGIVLVNGWGGGSLSISGFLYGILSAEMCIRDSVEAGQHLYHAVDGLGSAGVHRLDKAVGDLRVLDADIQGILRHLILIVFCPACRLVIGVHTDLASSDFTHMVFLLDI